MEAGGGASRHEREASAASSPWLCLAAGIGVFLAVCAFFFSFDHPWTLRGDNKVALFPLNLLAYRSWLSGSAPEWSGGLWAGYPVLADPTSGSLYWPNFLFFALTPDPHLRAYDLSTAFHLALMTAGTVRLLQVLGASTRAALFAGVLTLLAPTQQWFAAAILHSYSPLAWWPWTFIAAEQLSRAGSRTLGGPMFVGWLALGSQALWYPEFALYSGVVALAWLVTRTGEQPILQRGLRGLLLCTGGVVLAAPQLLPTTLYQSATIRQEAVPLAAASFVSFTGSLWSLIVPAADRVGLSQYVGGAAFLLAAVAVVRRQPRTAFLSTLAVLAFALALGDRTPLFAGLHALPIFENFRAPMKFFLLFEFAIVWLAGLGANVLLRRRGSRWLVAAGLLLMAVAVAERVAFDAHTLRDETNLPDGKNVNFATLHDRMLGSGLIEAASGVSGQPPPRILETIGLLDLTMLYGLDQLMGGPTPLKSSKHQELLSNQIGPMSRAKLDLFGVHYLLAKPEHHGCDVRARRYRLKLIEQTETTCLFENPGRPPRFSLLGALREVPSFEVMAAFVRTDPGGPIPVQRPGADTDLSARISDGTVEVTAYRPGAVRLSVDAEAPALLLVRESLADGWRAEVDGAEAPLYPAAGLFFAVPVPKGVHEVRLSYRTPGFRPGLLVSVAWILGAGGVWGLQRRAGQASGPHDPIDPAKPAVD